MRRRIRYAVVGLGHFAQAAILPAFDAARGSELVAVFSGDAGKRAEIADRYDIAHALPYEEYDAFLRTGAVDAVYIALPNTKHAAAAIRAADAGVHVLCEKPMAVDEAECMAMIEACKRTNVKLMIAYRLHFDRANLRAIELVRSGRIGDVRLFHSVFSMQVREGNIRTEAELGGGPLYDIGIYCINAARYILRAEPNEVLASMTQRRHDERFREVEDQCAAILRFPGDRLATFDVSFSAVHSSRYEAVGTKGRVALDPAYGYSEPLRLETEIDGKKRRRTFRRSDQVAAEIIYFSECIVFDQHPEPSGWEGLADVRIIQAVQESARTRRAVAIEPVSRPMRPEVEQASHVSPHPEPDIVKAPPPRG
jgi:predicted dehydrogenase